MVCQQDHPGGMLRHQPLESGFRLIALIDAVLQVQGAAAENAYVRIIIIQDLQSGLALQGVGPAAQDAPGGDDPDLVKHIIVQNPDGIGQERQP